MNRTRQRRRKRGAAATARGGVRALRQNDLPTQLEQRLLGLRFTLSVPNKRDARKQFAQRLARVLRAERRAGRTGGPGYDPLRHLLLARLDRLLRAQRNRAS